MCYFGHYVRWLRYFAEICREGEGGRFQANLFGTYNSTQHVIVSQGSVIKCCTARPI